MTLETDIANITTVLGGAVDWVTSILTLFMQPPLSIFVGLGIFGIAWRKVKGVVVRRA